MDVILSGSECPRTDEVGEHHRDMAALGGVRGLRRCRRWLQQALRGAQVRDCLEQPHTMAQRQTKLLKVSFGQLRQDISLDGVFAEHRLVLTKTKLLQPNPDVHGHVS
jgi:hypothetical protein